MKNIIISLLLLSSFSAQAYEHKVVASGVNAKALFEKFPEDVRLMSHDVDENGQKVLSSSRVEEVYCEKTQVQGQAATYKCRIIVDNYD